MPMNTEAICHVFVIVGMAVVVGPLVWGMVR
nr:MAG TPA: hypothetical protein [Caudoviricetes sp.]